MRRKRDLEHDVDLGLRLPVLAWEIEILFPPQASPRAV